MVQTLFDLDTEDNAMTPAFVLKLDIKVCPTNVWAQKIDCFTLTTYRIVIAIF